MDKNATYIVTGCTGYVGNVLAKKLMDEGCNVVGLARSEDKVRRVYGEHAPQIVYGDVTKQEDADRLFVGNGPFVVIHTVAKVSIGEAKAKEVYDVTVNGTRNIVDACVRHGAAKLLHISSTEVLPADIGEDADYRPDPKRVRQGEMRSRRRSPGRREPRAGCERASAGERARSGRLQQQPHDSDDDRPHKRQAAGVRERRLQRFRHTRRGGRSARDHRQVRTRTELHLRARAGQDKRRTRGHRPHDGAQAAAYPSRMAGLYRAALSVDRR